MVTILLAVPGLLVLTLLAVSPLFQLWDDRASDRVASTPERTDAVVGIPAPRAAHENRRAAHV